MIIFQNLLQSDSSHLPFDLPADQWEGNVLIVLKKQDRKVVLSSNVPNVQMRVSNHPRETSEQLLVIL